MTKVQIYSKSYCPYCKMTKATLNRLGIDFEDFDVTHNTDLEEEMRIRSQRNTVPQIFINGKHLGGNDDLQAALKSGKLHKILETQKEVA